MLSALSSTVVVRIVDEDSVQAGALRDRGDRGGVVSGLVIVGAEHEVGRVERLDLTDLRVDDQLRRRAALRQRPGDGRVRPVGRDEVHQGLRVLELLAEVHPVGVGLQLAVVRRGEDLPAHVVQRRDALAARPGHVQGRQVQGEAQQLVAQRLDDELVDLLADLVRQAHDDGAGSLCRRQRHAVPAVEVCRRVQEPVEQVDVVVQRRTSRHRLRCVEPRDRVGEHRVAEAVDRVGELGRDGRVDVGLVEREGLERVDPWLDLPGELLEHQVLVLHLRHEACSLEQALAVPAVRAERGLPLGEGGHAAG